MFAKQFYLYKLSRAFFQTWAFAGFSAFPLFLTGRILMAGSRQPDGGRESYHFRGNQNLGLGRLLAMAG